MRLMFGNGVMRLMFGNGVMRVMFGNGVMSVMFEPKTGDYRERMHNMEFHNLCCLSDTRVWNNSGNIGKESGMHGSEGNLEQIFVWKTRRKESIQKVKVKQSCYRPGVAQRFLGS